MWNLYRVTDEARNSFYVVASGTEHAAEKYDDYIITLSGTMHWGGRVVKQVDCLASDQVTDMPWATFIP